MLKVYLLLLVGFSHVVEVSGDVPRAAGSFEVLAVFIDPRLEGGILVLHVLAESFASCLTEFTDVPSVSCLESTVVRLSRLFTLGVLRLHLLIL